MSKNKNHHQCTHCKKPTMNCDKVVNVFNPARESAWLDLQMLWRRYQFQSKTLIVRLESADHSEIKTRLDKMNELQNHIRRIETELGVQDNLISRGQIDES